MMRYPALAVLLLQHEPEPLMGAIVEGRPPAGLRARFGLSTVLRGRS